jgi:hypothetical protein
VARILSILFIGFILLLLIGEVLFPHAEAVFQVRDIIAMIFFPTGVVVGLILAWRKELLGGSVAVGSLAAFYMTLFLFDGRFPRGPFFLLLASPGILFVLASAAEMIESHSRKSARKTG